MTKLNHERLRERSAQNDHRPNQPPSRWRGCAKADRIYLTTKYADRIAVKANGAVWDPDERRWYITPQHNQEHFRPWLPQTN